MTLQSAIRKCEADKKLCFFPRAIKGDGSGMAFMVRRGIIVHIDGDNAPLAPASVLAICGQWDVDRITTIEREKRHHATGL